MYYFAQINMEDGSFNVSIPQFKNINTYGDTLEEALQNAEEALNGCIESDFNRGYKIPKTRNFNGNNYYKIPIRSHIKLAFQLRTIRNKRSQLELAKELGISYQAYQRLENPGRCNPTVKTLEKLARVFKKNLEISIR